MSDYSVPTHQHTFDATSIRFVRRLQWLSALVPALLTLALVVLAWRASSLIGHWPQAWIDDPKSVPSDMVFNGISMLVVGLDVGYLLSFMLFPVTTILLLNRNSRWQTGLALGVYGVSLGLYFLVGSELLTWYFD